MRLSLLALVCACTPEAPTSAVVSARAPSTPPAITLRDVEFVHSRGNSVFAFGHVDGLTYVRETGDTLATAATVRFPRDQRPGSAVDISAPRARGNPLETRVSGEGGVHFENQHGDRGQTESATYEGKRGQASGERPVELFGPGFELKSPGFRWEQADDVLDLGPAQLVTRGPSR